MMLKKKMNSPFPGQKTPRTRRRRERKVTRDQEAGKENSAADKRRENNDT